MHSINLILTKSLKNDLSQISKSRYPEESCAALFGTITVETQRIFKINIAIELRNIVHSPTEFRIDELELYHHCVSQSKENFSLLGIFHSHPNDAYISQYDRTTIINVGILYPDLIWVVFGNRSNKFKAFHLENAKKIKEISIPTNLSP